MAAAKRDVQKWPQGRYKLTERAYIGRIPGADHEPLEAGTDVVWDGMPGPHMDPLDAQARANVEHALRTQGRQTLDPTQDLSLIVGEVDDVDAEIEAMNARVEALKARRRASLAAGHQSHITAPTALTAAAARAAEPAVAAMTALPGLPPPMSAPPPH